MESIHPQPQQDTQDGYDDLFESAGPHSRKIRCRVCGATGYPRGGIWLDLDRHWWGNRHLAGHAPCRWCGKPTTVLLNGSPRTHGRCPAGVVK